MSMKHFNVGIKALIVRDNKLLLVRGVGDRLFWDAPGGRIDDNESIDQTLGRELKEELPNLTSFEIHEIVAAKRVHKEIGPDVSLVLIFYRVSAEFSGGEPQLSEEHTEYRWVTKAEALEIGSDSVKAAIPQLKGL